MPRSRLTDGGPGIPAPDRARLFSRFGRGGATGSEGSGLGLYVSRERCRAIGGDLVLEEPAVEGAGASFSVYLPAEHPAEG